MRRRTMDIAKRGDGVNLKKKKRQNPFHESCKNITVKDDFIYNKNGILKLHLIVVVKAIAFVAQTSLIEMCEKLCLQWNDYQENIKGAFSLFREDHDFNNVTLVCEDGQQVEAHKVILAASSPFFQNLLRRNKHPHPMVYMRGVKFDELSAIVDFLYRGEANVVQDNLDSFLAIAEELQLRGLMGGTDERVEDINAEGNLHWKLLPASNSGTKLPNAKTETTVNKFVRADSKTVAIPSYHSGDLNQLEEKVRSMMEKSQNKHANGKQAAHVCKVCGKEGMGNAIKDHIEANHLERIVIPCSLCDKTFRSRASLRNHKKKHTETNLI